MIPQSRTRAGDGMSRYQMSRQGVTAEGAPRCTWCGERGRIHSDVCREQDKEIFDIRIHA